MPPKKWDDEDGEDNSSSPSAPGSPVVGASRRRFEDEEDGEVLESWDNGEDSEVEREKAKKAAEAKEKAAAAAAANKKSKSERIAGHQAERARIKAEEEEEETDDETEAERRERLRRTEKESDLKHAEDMFGDIGISANRSKVPPSIVVIDSKDPDSTINLATVPIFSPQTKLQFEKLRSALSPIISANSKRAHYGIFLEEFTRDLVKEMSSDQIKKIASALTRVGNEKMKEEKAADKTGKKTKAAKTKTSLVTNRANTADVGTYDDDAFGDDDFM